MHSQERGEDSITASASAVTVQHAGEVLGIFAAAACGGSDAGVPYILTAAACGGSARILHNYLNYNTISDILYN